MANEQEEEEQDALPELGSPSTSPVASNTASPRPRRRAYAPTSGRDFSTSAKKRQSVVALGSIRVSYNRGNGDNKLSVTAAQHLQHHFAKTGLQAKEPVLGPSGKPLPLALPGSRPPNSADYEYDDFSQPSPSPPSPTSQLKQFDVPEGPSWKVRRAEVWREIADVCERWGLVEMGSRLSTRSASSAFENSESFRSDTPLTESEGEENLILSLLQTTTSAIRATQKYFLSLPPEKLPTGFSTSQGKGDAPQPALPGLGLPSSLPSTLGAPARHSSLGFSTASRPNPRFVSSSMASSSFRRSQPPPSSRAEVKAFPSSSSYEEDPLLVLRKASLDTLGTLKEMEARYRLSGSESSLQLSSDEARELAESMNDIKLAPSAPLLTFEDSNASTSGSSSDTGASAAMASSSSLKGHLYRDDVDLKELSGEAESVRKWIETVDALLLASSSKKSGRTDAPASSADISEMPEWAKENAFPDDPLARAHALMQTHLPIDLLIHLFDYGASSASAPEQRKSFLLSLSDGQLLCIAYNTALRRSQRPWGFVPQASIHDLVSLTKEQPLTSSSPERAKEGRRTSQGGLDVPDADARRSSSEGMARGSSGDGAGGEGRQKVGLTFRRLENLRVFIAALKLRYLISDPSSASSGSGNKSGGVDARIIARKEDGWLEMLETVVCTWVNELAKEKRGEEEDDD